MEKQIEEMTRDLCKCYAEVYGGYSETAIFDARTTAQNMCKIGYRKESDMVEEIFTDIDNLLEIDEYNFDEVFEQSRSEDEDKVSLALSNYVSGLRQIFAELKKKYTEDKK